MTLGTDLIGALAESGAPVAIRFGRIERIETRVSADRIYIVDGRPMRMLASGAEGADEGTRVAFVEDDEGIPLALGPIASD